MQAGLIRLTSIEDAPKVDLIDYKNFLTSLYSMRRKAIKHKLPEEVLLEKMPFPKALRKAQTPKGCRHYHSPQPF